MPNLFLLIGAQKSGTTSVYEILKHQPGLILTHQKESKFFLRDELYDQGIDYYSGLFAEPLGDNSGPYLDVDPDFFHFDHVPKRIYDTFGDEVRFFLILRNPVDRAYSAWQMETFRKRDKLPFKQAIKVEELRSSGDLDNQRFAYLKRGLYSQQLQAYLKYFPLATFQVFIFELDFLKQRQAMFDAMLHGMGLEAAPDLPLEIRRNPARKIRNSTFDKLLSGDNIIRKAVRAVISEEQSRKWKDKLYALNASQKIPDRLSSVDHDQLLKDYFLEDILDLQKLLNRDLSVWTRPRVEHG